jgi:hypothetical protein
MYEVVSIIYGTGTVISIRETEKSQKQSQVSRVGGGQQLCCFW